MKKPLLALTLAVSILAAPLALATPAQAAPASMPVHVTTTAAPIVFHTKPAYAKVATKTQLFYIEYTPLTKKSATTKATYLLLIQGITHTGVIYLEPISETGYVNLIKLLRRANIMAQEHRVNYAFTTQASMLKQVKASIHGQVQAHTTGTK